jgi:hypothetical protein
MDFRAIFDELLSFLKGRKCRFAVVGAFGLHAYGLSRATGDIDFIVDGVCRDELIAFLEGLRYETLYRSSGYSNHVRAVPQTMGRLDFIYVEGRTAEILFSQVTTRLSLGGWDIPVPRPEHLIALEVLAMKNDPARTFREMADIQFLMGLPGIDEEMVKSQFEKRDFWNDIMKSREKALLGDTDLDLAFSDEDIAALSRRDTHMETADYLKFLQALAIPSTEALLRRSGPRGERFELDN